MFWSPKLMLSSLTTGFWDLNICRNIALPSQCDTEKCILTTNFLILLWTKTDEGGGRAVLQQTTSDEVRVTSSCPWVTTPPQHSAQLLGLFVEDTFWFSPYTNHLTMCFDILRTSAFDPFPNIKVHFALGELPPSRLSTTCQYFQTEHSLRLSVSQRWFIFLYALPWQLKHGTLAGSEMSRPSLSLRTTRLLKTCLITHYQLLSSRSSKGENYRGQESWVPERVKQEGTVCTLASGCLMKIHHSHSLWCNCKKLRQ